MATILPDRRYAKTHEWIRVEGDTATLGVSDFAQEQMMDVVFVELPEVGRELTAGDICAAVESTKAASDIFAPIAGEVTEVNEALEAEPELINNDPFGAGWILKMTVVNPGDVDEMLDAEAYEAACAADEH